MKAREIRNKSKDEIIKLEADLLIEGFNLRIQKATGQMNSPDKLSKVRKNLARIYTILSEKKRQEIL